MNSKFNVENDSKWILPHELKKQEIAEYSSSLANLDLKSDFGSYKALRYGKNKTMIETHNSCGKRSIFLAEHLSRFINRYIKKPMVIADMGCGAGFIANDLHNIIKNCEIFAFDVSEDAIAYGKEKFPKVHFEAKVIAPDTEFGILFNIIYAHEFYPFTRTNSFEFQKSYIDNFLKQIDFDNNGLLIISLKHTKKCLLNNYDEFIKNYQGEYQIERFIIPSFKIYNLFKLYNLSSLITVIINIILNRKNSYIIIVRRLHKIDKI